MSDQPDISLRLMYWRIEAARVAREAEKDGVIVTIERAPRQPLAMRNHYASIDVREKR